MMMQAPSVLSAPANSHPLIRLAHSLLLLVAGLAAEPCAGAQSLVGTLLPQPNLRLTLSGDVKAMVRQGDGKLILGGSFAIVDNTLRKNLARFNADGSLDAAWTVSTDAPVNALALDASDNLFVGGGFTKIGGVVRNGLAKIAPDGTVDGTWNPSPNSIVSALLLSGNQLYIAGSFGNVGGTARTGVARVSATAAGALDLAWNPAPNNRVTALVELGGNLYLGGGFSQVNGTPRNRLAKVSTAGVGALDATWNPAADAGINAMAMDGSGGLIVGGLFFNVGGLARNCIAKLDPAGSGTASASWVPAAASFGCSVVTLANDGNGGMLVGGGFTTLGGQPRNNVGRVLDAGTLDPNWNPDVQTQLYLSTAGVHAILPLPGGMTQIGGVFDTVSAARNFASARLTSTGSRDAGFNAALDSLGEVRAITDDPVSGAVYVGGTFELVDGTQVRRNLLRLAPDFTLDNSWAGSVNGSVYALLVDAAQRVYVGGFFTRSDATTRNYVARFDSAGILDAGWNPNANFNINAMALTPDGSSLYLAGGFTQMGGQTRNRLALVSTSGTGAPPAAWNPNANNAVFALKVRPSDGTIYVGGAFTSLGGLARGYVGKIASSGVVDAQWSPNLNNFVEALDIDPRPPQASPQQAKSGSAGSIGVGGDFFVPAGPGLIYDSYGLINVLPDGSGAFDPLQLESPPQGSRVLGLGDFPIDAFPQPLSFVVGSFPSVSGTGDSGMRIYYNVTGALEFELKLPDFETLNTANFHYYFFRHGQADKRVSGSLPAILVGGRISGVDNQQRIGLAAIQLTAPLVFADGFE